MLYWLGHYLTEFFGPARLLTSHLVLIALGTLGAGFLTWFLLPRKWGALPRDRGKMLVKDGHTSSGKPTGAGCILASIILPVVLFCMPLANFWDAAAADLPGGPPLKQALATALWNLGLLACVYLSMLTGYLDDRSTVPWGELRKGLCDLLIAAAAAACLCRFKDMVVWLPFVKNALVVSWMVYMPVATLLLWFTINATNCSDGVDGLAGSLTLMALISLGALLYGVIGYKPLADYLLIPHNADGARYAILLFTAAGGLAGYLWYNAKPSHVLMGDAGSRMFGLLVGIGVLASGNPLLVFVVSPVILINGGAGLFKLLLLRFLKRLGFDTRLPGQRPGDDDEQHVFVRALHSIRFPLHDHFRNKIGWSDAEVLMRFVLIQAFLTPVLFVLFIKIR